MRISRHSWHYRMLAKFHALNLSKPPEQITLCSYFWQIVGLLFLGWPMLIALGVVCAVAFAVWLVLSILTGTILCWFLGYRPTSLLFQPWKWDWKKKGKNQPRFVAFSLPRVWNQRILPVYIPLALGLMASLIAGVYTVYAALCQMLNQPDPFKWGMTTHVVNGVGMVVVAIVLIIGIALVWTSPSVIEARSLTKAFLKAKKEKLCPLIRFED